MKLIKEATKEEIKENYRRCWGGQCKRKAWLTDWTGWKFCFKCWQKDYKYGRCHGLLQALKDTKIF